MTVYAYDYELAHALTAASNPLTQEMRLVWWREALDEIFEGRAVRAHPTAQALADTVQRRGLARDLLEGMIDARYRLLDPAPLARQELMELGCGTAGFAGILAARIIGDPGDGVAYFAARDWNAIWQMARMPTARLKAEERASVQSEIRRSLEEARTVERRDLPYQLFPIVAHAALTGPYLEGRRPSDIEKRWRLFWAVLTGRI